MPLKYVQPEEAFEVLIDGFQVPVYHVYKSGDIGHRQAYWYTFDMAEDSDNEFDIRDLPNWSRYPQCTGPDVLLQDALNRGLVHNDGNKIVTIGHKPTPGPWHVTKEANGAILVTSTPADPDWADDDVCRVYGGNDGDKAQALTDARAIAAVPDLFAYKNYIESNLERIERGDWTPVCFDEFLMSEERKTYGGE